MAQTLCIKCGSDLKVSSDCNFCQEPLIFACTSCDYVTEEKVHTDCRNAKVLAKTEVKEETSPTPAFKPITGNQEKSNADKPKEEVIKEEPSSASYLRSEQYNKNFSNSNPFVAGAAVWQRLMTYWFNVYGVFLKNAPKMFEDWYDIFWKSWLYWAPQEQEKQ